MAQKEQSAVGTTSDTSQEQGLSAQDRATMREDARAAFSQQAQPDGGGMHDMPGGRTDYAGSALVGGVGQVAGGVIGVVRDTANTAIDGVGSVGQHAVHALTGLLVEVVGGVRQVAGAAVGGVKSTAQEAMRWQETSYQRPEESEAYRQQPQEVRREQSAMH